MSERICNWLSTTVGLLLAGIVVANSAQSATLIAQTGFNDAVGINSNGTVNSPYTLGGQLQGSGATEPGWLSNWVRVSGPDNSPAKASVVTSPVLEGDGAAKFVPSMGNVGGTHDATFKRRFGAAGAYSTGIYQLDFNLLIESMTIVNVVNGNSASWILYTGSSANDNAGVAVGAVAAQLSIQTQGNIVRLLSNGGAKDINGVPLENGVTTNAVVANLDLNEWYKVSMLINMDTRRWNLYLDDALVDSNLGFRSNTLASLQHIQLLPGRGNIASGTANDPSMVVYLDSVAVTQIPEPSIVALLGLGLVGAAGLLRRKKN